MRHTLLVAILLLALPTLGRSEVHPKKGAKLPDKPLLDEGVKPDDEGNGPPRIVWVACKGLKLREDPDNDSSAEVELDKPIEFMQRFAIADETQETVLLVRTNREGTRVLKHLGWAPVKYLVRHPTAVQNANQVYRKAMIINSPQTQAEDKEFRDAIAVRTAPLATAVPAHAPFRLFSLFFVYKQVDGWVLLGSNFEFDPQPQKDEAQRDDALRVVLGWAPRNRLCIWNTREALDWDRASTLKTLGDGRRTIPGEIFADPDDAFLALSAAGAKDKPKPLFAEKFNATGESVHLPSRAMRFPLIDEREARDYIKRPIKGSDRPRKIEGNELLFVGGRGGLQTDGKETATAADVDKLQDALDKLQKQLNETEIVFIVDDTQSMKKWFKPVAEVFDEVVRLVTGGNRKVKIALTYYNDDEVDNSNPVIVGTLAPVKDVGEKLARELRTHEYHDGGGPREMVFAGLTQGIDGAGFSAIARKIVVLIGDMGDKSDPKVARHAAAVAKHFRGKGGDWAIDFFPIQVLDPETTDNKTDAKAFRTQMKSILKELEQDEDNYVCLKLNEDDPVTEDHKKELRAVVSKRYVALADQMDARRRDLDLLRRGEFDENTRIDEELVRILRDTYHVDVKEFAHGLQLFDYGYVWRNSAQANLPQVRHVILVDDGSMATITSLLDKLTVRRKRTTVKRLVPELIKTQLGDVTDEDARQRLQKLFDAGTIDLDEVLQKSCGLKVQSPFLKRKLKDLKDDRFTKDELLELQRKKLILDGIRKDKKVEVVKKAIEDDGYKHEYWEIVGDGANDNRRFEMGGRLEGDKTATQRSVIYYWIDFEKEWP